MPLAAIKPLVGAQRQALHAGVDQEAGHDEKSEPHRGAEAAQLLLELAQRHCHGLGLVDVVLLTDPEAAQCLLGAILAILDGIADADWQSGETLMPAALDRASTSSLR